VNEGKLSVNRFVELVSTTPARLFGLYPRKGELAPGSDADIVIWNPNAMIEISAKNASHARGLFHVRGISRKRECQNRVVARRSDRRQGRVSGSHGPRAFLKRAARGGAWQ